MIELPAVIFVPRVFVCEAMVSMHVRPLGVFVAVVVDRALGVTAVRSGGDQPAMVGTLADDGSLPAWAACDVHIRRVHGGQMAIAAEGGGLPVSAVRGQGSVGTQIVVAAVGGVHGQALIGL